MYFQQVYQKTSVEAEIESLLKGIAVNYNSYCYYV